MPAPELKNISRVRDMSGLAGLTAAAIAIHGYYFGLNDHAYYIPATKRVLQPSLYPHDAVFFLAQSRFTWFPELMAAGIRVSRLPLDVVFFVAQLVTIFLSLWAAQRLVRQLFADTRAEWAALAG